MSYLVLARKWRPLSFTDLVGQEHVRRTLENAIAQDRVAHAFLFTGVRGVGKTTSARILAKALNCEKGPTASPCLKCSACLEITEGTDMDVQEIDGASYNGVEAVRDLQQQLPYRPARDRFKIYIVDEVHMLSNAAWNAFLKTLEEPPPHVKFIFATTEVHKVPITILSRCQRYDFKMISAQVIGARLRYVLEQEKIQADEAAVSLLSREAAGSMRDAMSLLDQAIAWGGEKLLGDEVARVLGVASRSVLQELARTLVEGRADGCLHLVQQLTENGYDLGQVARDLLSVLRDLVVAKVCGDTSEQLFELSDGERQATVALAARAGLDDLVRLHQGFARSFDDIVRSPSPRAGLEMTLVRLSRRPPLVPLDALLARLTELEARLGGGPGGPAPGGHDPGRLPGPGGGASSRPAASASGARAGSAGSPSGSAGPTASASSTSAHAAPVASASAPLPRAQASGAMTEARPQLVSEGSPRPVLVPIQGGQYDVPPTFDGAVALASAPAPRPQPAPPPPQPPAAATRPPPAPSPAARPQPSPAPAAWSAPTAGPPASSPRPASPPPANGSGQPGNPPPSARPQPASPGWQQAPAAAAARPQPSQPPAGWQQPAPAPAQGARPQPAPPQAGWQRPATNGGGQSNSPSPVTAALQAAMAQAAAAPVTRRPVPIPSTTVAESPAPAAPKPAVSARPAYAPFQPPAGGAPAAAPVVAPAKMPVSVRPVYTPAPASVRAASSAADQEPGRPPPARGVRQNTPTAMQHDPSKPMPEPAPGVDFAVWKRVVERVREERPSLASVLEFAAPLKLGPAGVVLGFAPNSFVTAQASEPRHAELLTKAVRGECGPDASVSIELTESAASALTIARLKAADLYERRQRARQRVLEHPMVKAAMEIFGAELRDVRFEDDGRGR